MERVDLKLTEEERYFTVKRIKDLLVGKLNPGRRESLSNVLTSPGGPPLAKILYLIQTTAKSWDDYSGKEHYPVPSKEYGPIVAYFRLPMWEGEYGKSRISLATHIYMLLKSYLWKEVIYGEKQ